MFSNEDLKCLDPKYFSIITTDAYDVTIMSRNTGHYWYLHNPEYDNISFGVFQCIQVCYTAGFLTLGKEKVSAEITFAGFEIVRKKRMPS